MLRLMWNETADKLFLETAVCKENGPEAWDDQLSSGGGFLTAHAWVKWGATALCADTGWQSC